MQATNHHLPREFFLAGRAVFTVTNPTGDHFTYRINRGKIGTYDAWVVAYLSGPDNHNDYSYLGMLDSATGFIRATRGSKASEDTQVFRVARWAMRITWCRWELPPGYKIEHAGRCGRCGRVLTTPESIERGIGPECARKMEEGEQ